jgi:hypothetical protein
MSEIRRYGKFSVLQGSRDPDGFDIELTEGGLIPDVSLVTAVNLVGVDVRSGATETWTTTFVSSTATTTTWRHLFAQADTATLRTLRFVIEATRTGAANPIKCGVFDLQIEAP